jgi:hypothetical protein
LVRYLQITSRAFFSPFKTGMMAKEDLRVTENEDRTQGEKADREVKERNAAPPDPENGKKTAVKNASAAGLGAMGRNDQAEAGSGKESS